MNEVALSSVDQGSHADIGITARSESPLPRVLSQRCDERFSDSAMHVHALDRHTDLTGVGEPAFGCDLRRPRGVHALVYHQRVLATEFKESRDQPLACRACHSSTGGHRAGEVHEINP